MAEPVEVFISYSHKDEALKEELEDHLSLLQRGKLISVWHDRKIGAGREWADQIDERLESAQIILLLISAKFLASDYCHDIEMRRAMERHEAGEARVHLLESTGRSDQARPLADRAAAIRAKPRTGMSVIYLVLAGT